MSIQRVALIFDNVVRPETTGGYCLRALRELVQVEHFLPQEVSHISRTGFDLYLNIDDGLRYHLPADLHPCAWWVIDTHLDAAWAADKGRQFDWLFAAQRDGAAALQNGGISARWLPLACDPAIHRPHAVEKCRDVCFIGHVNHAARRDLLALVQQHFPNSFVGERYFDEFARTYSESRIGFNCSIKNDVNMRVFETLGCGPLLVTNDLRDNGQAELFELDHHLVTYRDPDELLDKLRFYLMHDDARDKIAGAGHAEVLARHTYRHRMQSLLETIERASHGTNGHSTSPPLSKGGPGGSREPVQSGDLNHLLPPPVQAGTTNEGCAPHAGPAWLGSVDLIIKTFLRPQALLRLLGSIAEFYPAAHVTIADDGNLRESPDPDSQACCRLIDGNPRFRLHSLPFAAGVTPGRNLLVDRTTRPFLLLLDDDFCLTAETRIDRLFERLQSDAHVGIVAGACIDVVGSERRPRNSGGTLEIQGDTLVIDSTGWRDRGAGLRDYVPQFALIRREVFNDVRWEGGIGGEHYDFCLQLQRSRWKVAHDLSVQIDHHHFTPTLPGYAQRRFECTEAQQWLLHKWKVRRIVQDGQIVVECASPTGPTAGANPTSHRPADPSKGTTKQGLPVKDSLYFEFPRPEVVALIPLSARRVLDIGCGAGRLGALLKERQPAEVMGIELQSQAAGLARRRLDKVLEQNVEDPEFDFPDGRFDCVVCADVLEHLREPAAVLDKIRRWLTPEGALVASLPNVRHHSVVASLLEGNWTYESAGLLDSDHVRFFTRREIEKLLFRHGFEIQALHAKPGPGHDEWDKAGRPGNVRVGSLNIAGLASEDAEEFFTYQYLVVARPNLPRPLGEGRGEGDAIQKLARAYPWPATKPQVPVPTDKLGWFKDSPRELMRSALTPETKLVVELGAWLGLSTRFIADQAPRARVITIDHWEGSREHKNDPACAAMLPTLFETFVAMNWEYRDRILPLRMTTRQGLETVAAHGVKPDVIFIDADHAYESVSADLRLARELFPQARIIGDDYDYPDVGRAVDEFAAREGWHVEPVGTGWRSWRLVNNTLPPLGRGEGGSRGMPINSKTTGAIQQVAGLTSIIIVTFNQLAYTKECIDSIRLRTDESYELILVDNGSTDGTVEYLRKVAGMLRMPSAATASTELADAAVGTADPTERITLIENHNNRGFPAAVNQGLQLARGEFALLLNNDTVVTTGWLRRMLEVMERNPRVGLVGPCSNNVSGSQMVPVTYQNMASLDGFAWEWGKQHHEIIEETDRLIGFCLMIKRAVLDQIGLLDEQFGIGCFEDDDFCLRALRAGWKAVIARESFVHHYGNRTFLGNGVDLGSVLRINREKFLQKWQNGDIAPTNGATPESGSKSGAAPAATEPSDSRHRYTVRRALGGGLLLEPKSCRLSLCMIVRDNEPTIGPCLESIRPWVDEIVIADTGSKDRTPEICRQFGARVFEFPWCDDFSAARNESLKHARGQWIFWMDSDDTIPADCGRKLRQLVDRLCDEDLAFPPLRKGGATEASDRSGRREAEGSSRFWRRTGGVALIADLAKALVCAPTCEQPKTASPAAPASGNPPQRVQSLCVPPAETGTTNILGYILQVHCPGPGADGQHDMTVVDHVKLIRNRPDLRFSGRIHEQLLPAIRAAGGDVAWTDIYVVHSGSDHSPKGWQRKLERDLRILHQELAETPDHPFVLFNLGMTYADAANHPPPLPLGEGRGEGHSISHYDSAIYYLRRCLAVSEPNESHLRKAYALLVSSLGQTERHDEAWTFCQQGLALYPDDKELLFRCAMLHHHFGRLTDAEQTYLRVLNDREERHFASVDRGLAGYKARHNLALVYDDMGRLDEAERQWCAVAREVPGYSPAWRGLGDILLRQGRIDTVEELCVKLAKIQGPLHREAHVLRGRVAAARGIVDEAVRELRIADQANSPDLEPLRLLSRVLFEHGEPAAAEAALQELCSRDPQDAAAHHNLGLVHLRRHNRPAAVQSLRRSLELRPNAPATRQELESALQLQV